MAQTFILTTPPTQQNMFHAQNPQSDSPLRKQPRLSASSNSSDTTMADIDMDGLDFEPSRESLDLFELDTRIKNAPTAPVILPSMPSTFDEAVHSLDSPSSRLADSRKSFSNNINFIASTGQIDQQQQDHAEFPEWAADGISNCWCPVRENLGDASDDSGDEMMIDVQNAMSAEDDTYESSTQLPPSTSRSFQEYSQHDPRMRSQSIPLSMPREQTAEEKQRRKTVTVKEARGFWSQCCGSTAR